MFINVDFKKWLTLQLFNRDLKVQSFCREVGISRARYYQYMHGGLPSKKTLLKLATYFKLDTEIPEVVQKSTREVGWRKGRKRVL